MPGTRPPDGDRPMIRWQPRREKRPSRLSGNRVAPGGPGTRSDFGGVSGVHPSSATSPKTAVNEKHDAITQARSIVGDVRLAAFLRAAAAIGNRRVHAVTLANDRLDRHESLDALFATERRSLEEDQHGYSLCFSLSAQPISESIYRIDYGCTAGPDAGDGSTWVVEFDGDAVRAIEQESFWIA